MCHYLVWCLSAAGNELRAGLNVVNCYNIIITITTVGCILASVSKIFHLPLIYLIFVFAHIASVQILLDFKSQGSTEFITRRPWAVAPK